MMSDLIHNCNCGCSSIWVVFKVGYKSFLYCFVMPVKNFLELGYIWPCFSLSDHVCNTRSVVPSPLVFPCYGPMYCAIKVIILVWWKVNGRIGKDRKKVIPNCFAFILVDVTKALSVFYECVNCRHVGFGKGIDCLLSMVETC